MVVLAAFMVGCSPPAAETETPDIDTHSITIMTFNVENLFDNEDDAGKTDETYFALSDKQSEEHKATCNEIENFGNLLNSDWGRVDSYSAPSNVAPANVAIPVAGGPYLLTPTASYTGTAATVVSSPEIAKLASVYRIQFGLRFRF